MQNSPAYCCPRCHGALEHWVDRYECQACARRYPIIAGIPDFRLFSDRYISLEDDRAKGLRLAEVAQHASFEELVRFYYSITPEVPDDLAGHYTRHHLAGVGRGEGVLQRLTAYGFSEALQPDSSGLDLGCGTGGFVAVAATHGMKGVGLDIAFRWLVIGRKRLEELGQADIPLVCACAEHLPFADHVFDWVTAEGLLEHTHTQDEIFREATRVRRPGGPFAARTVNRFAIGPEPHVGVWGVGFLPRRWMDPYVQRIKGISYQNIRLESASSLRQLIRDSGANDLLVRTPHFVTGDYAYRPRWQQFLFRAHNVVARWPGLQTLLLWFGPFLDVTGRRST
jgi:SAM-dependent methyltransferase